MNLWMPGAGILSVSYHVIRRFSWGIHHASQHRSPSHDHRGPHHPDETVLRRLLNPTPVRTTTDVMAFLQG